MKYSVKFLVIVLVIAFLFATGCSQKMTDNSDANTSNTTLEGAKSSDIVLDKPLVIDAENEMVTLELNSGKMTKTLLNESNRTVDLYPKANTSTNTSLPPVETPSGISLEELAVHNTRYDCWVAYNGKVYDITTFLPVHPGSAGAIIPYCGTSDAFTTAFERQHKTSKVYLLKSKGILKGDLA